MKRWTTLAIALALCLLCACGQGEVTTVPTNAPTTIAPTSITEPPVVEPIVYPESYRDAPEAYWPVLHDMYTLLYITGLDDGEPDRALRYADDLLGAELDTTGNGYAVVDINNDGTPELAILYGSETSDTSSLYALFTLKDGEPVGITSYGRRDGGALATDGTIYKISSCGTNCAFACSYRLEAGAAELSKLTEYGVDDNPLRDSDYPCFKEIGNGFESITRDEFNAVWDLYWHPPNPINSTSSPSSNERKHNTPSPKLVRAFFQPRRRRLYPSPAPHTHREGRTVKG